MKDNTALAQYECGGLKNFCYVIRLKASPSSGVWLVDPHTELGPIVGDLKRQKLSIKGIVLTHTHYDHVGGLKTLHELWPEYAELRLPLWVHPLDAHRLSKSNLARYDIQELRDGMVLDESDGESIDVLHTPGHTRGGCCFVVSTPEGRYVLTGDTLFINDCGRTDLEEGSNEEMFASLQRLKQLPADTILLPGHHYAPACRALMGEQLKSSPPLLCKTVAQLAALT